MSDVLFDARNYYESAEKATQRTIDTVLTHYLATMLWTGVDFDHPDEYGNFPYLDEAYWMEDFSEEAKETAFDDVVRFLATCWGDNPDGYDEAPEPIDLSEWDPEQIGQDFALTRNREGAGFWDRGLPNGNELSELAYMFGSTTLYAQDDYLFFE